MSKLQVPMWPGFTCELQGRTGSDPVTSLPPPTTRVKPGTTALHRLGLPFGKSVTYKGAVEGTGSQTSDVGQFGITIAWGRDLPEPPSSVRSE